MTRPAGGTSDTISFLGLCLVVLGAFLPWASTPDGGVQGLEGDGAITLIMAFTSAVLIGTSAARDQGVVVRHVLPVIGILTFTLATVNAVALEKGNTVGIGLAFTAVGGLLVTFGSRPTRGD